MRLGQEEACRAELEELAGILLRELGGRPAHPSASASKLRLVSNPRGPGHWDVLEGRLQITRRRIHGKTLWQIRAHKDYFLGREWLTETGLRGLYLPTRREALARLQDTLKLKPYPGSPS